MHREVVHNDTTLFQVLDIYFLFEGLYNNGLNLSRVELVKQVACVAPERQYAVIRGQSAVNFEDLTHQIDNRVIKEEHNYYQVSVAGCFVEVVRLLYLVIDRVVNSSSGHKRKQLTQHHIESVSAGYDTVVWRSEVGNLLSLCEVFGVHQPVLVIFVIDIEVFSPFKEVFDEIFLVKGLSWLRFVYFHFASDDRKVDLIQLSLSLLEKLNIFVIFLFFRRILKLLRVTHLPR